jgi:hypothetical protein
MTAYRPGIDPDRRKKPDVLSRSISYFVVAGWLIMLIALFFISEAKPQSQNFFDKLTTDEPSTTWNLGMAGYIFYLMILGFVAGTIGIFFNLKRRRRKSDEFRISLILITLISLLGIIFYTVFL